MGVIRTIRKVGGGEERGEEIFCIYYSYDFRWRATIFMETYDSIAA